MTVIDEKRCERTDLLVSMCSHCRGLPWVAPALDPEFDPFNPPAPPADHVGAWFTAQYPGECGNCTAPVIPGDTIRADGRGGYECADCGKGGLA